MRNLKHFLLMTFLSMFALGLFVACSPAPDKSLPGDPCTKNEDCQKGGVTNLDCRAKKCRTIIPNKPPTAEFAVYPSKPKVGQKVNLDARNSFDPDGDDITYHWTMKGRPQNSQVDIKNKDQQKAYFIPDIPGEYSVQLIVKDKKTESKPMLVKFTVADQANQKPIADAGKDQTVAPGQTVVLDGSQSFDPERKKITYDWTFRSKPSGSKAELKKADTVHPEFVPDKAGRYRISLVVTDVRNVPSAPDFVTIVAMEGYDKIPVLQKVTPNSARQGDVIDAVLEGKDFVAGADIRLGSTTFKSSYVSSSKLRARMDLSTLNPGKLKLYVINPNGKASKPLTFTLAGIPTPHLDSLSPDHSFVRMKPFITAKGKNFVKGNSEAYFIGDGQAVALKTDVLNSTTLKFQLDLTNTFEGTYRVKVVNNPGNLTSNILPFSVGKAPPRPSLCVLNPPKGVVGKKIAFSVHSCPGELGFDRQAVIYFDGKPIKTKYVRRNQLQADPVLDLSQYKPGSYEVFVRNPGNQDSPKEQFRVIDVDPQPKLDRMLPFTIFLDEVNKHVAIYGQDFIKGAKLVIGANEITDKAGPFGQLFWKSDTYMEASIDLTDRTKWTSGNVSAYVVNPNKKRSNAFSLTISYRVPVLNALAPSSWTTKCNLDLELYGLNFLKKSKVNFGSMVYSTNDPTHKLTYVSSKLLRMSLPTKTMSPQTFQVRVSNGANAISSPLNFKLNSASNLPTPAIQYVSPSVAPADTKITVRINPDYSVSGGSRSFIQGAYVLFNNKKVPTTCNGSKYTNYCYSLQATIDLTGLKVGSYDLYVVNPCNVRSLPVSFNVIAPPPPYISSFQPPYAKPGDKMKLIIKGGHFVKGLTLYWDNKPLKVKVKSPNELETDGLLDLSKAKFGSIDVQVKNPSGVLSGIVKYSIVSSFVPKITDVTNNVQQLRPTLLDMVIKGSGFVLSSSVYVDNELASFSYVSSTEMRITSFNASKKKPGIYMIEVRNGSRHSNFYPLVILPVPPPQINYIRPASMVAGSQNSVRLYVYGQRFVNTGRRSSVVIKDSKGKDLSKLFTRKGPSYSSTTYIYGDFDVSSLSIGKYDIQVKNPTGELSNIIKFSVTAPPPPVAQKLNPEFAFRGVANQRLQILGSNFLSTDYAIFNGDTLNRIPGTVIPKPHAFEFTVDLSKLKAARQYDIYVIRCVDKACTQFSKTSTLQLNVKNPSCAIVSSMGGCSAFMKPANSEACDKNDGNVCRPVCKTNADCIKLDPKAKWSCKSGFCK